MPDPIFLAPDAFTAADDLVNWKRVGVITAVGQNANIFNLQSVDGPAPQLSILSPTLFRLRFNARADYSQDFSYALPSPAIAVPTPINLVETPSTFQIDTGGLRLEIRKQPYALSVYRRNQLIHTDAERNLVYVQQSVANFKVMPNGAFYYGFGEKAGLTLNKRGQTMTFFNYDNFSYPTADDQAMYVSIPFLIETNPSASPPYSYGLFLDNPSQTYIDLGHRREGLFYLGAVYGEMNVYFMFGEEVAGVLDQYTGLTGQSPIPPKYVFGFHQGAYGYNVGVGQGGLGQLRQTIIDVANRYRAERIPCDGLHLDVDFQHEYRMFTAGSSPTRRDPVTFGDPVALLRALHAQGFKCSTNITPMIKDDLGTQGNVPGGAPDPYPSRDLGFQQDALLRNPNSFPSEFFLGQVNYGNDPITNEDLGAKGFYPDLTNPKARAWYGEQYTF